MKHLFLILMSLAISLVASQSAVAQGGFFLKRTGVELGYRPGTDLLYKTNAPFYSKARIGGKLDNFFIGAGYITANSYYYGLTEGWTADLGYDIAFGKGWGLNLGLGFLSTTFQEKTLIRPSKVETQIVDLPLYFYKQFNVSKKFFIKPFLGIYAGAISRKTYYYRTYYNSTTGTYEDRIDSGLTTSLLFPSLHAGLGFGYNVNDNLVLGAMPTYTPYIGNNVYGLQLSVGYNFYTQESFDGKAKR
jgi:Outer membrane protein beta-barrel domain